MPLGAHLHVVLVEDDPADAILISRTLAEAYPGARVDLVDSRGPLVDRLNSGPVDVVVSDSSVPGCGDLQGFHLTRAAQPGAAFIYLTSSVAHDRDMRGLRALGVSAFLSKDNLAALPPAIDEALTLQQRERLSVRRLAGYERLVNVITELSSTRTIEGVMAIVRRAARDLTGADGATFVLRDGDHCHYADEDAIGPLWKGQRFPMSSCISGWAMMHRQPAVVPDIYQDPRIPLSAYEPTFVRSVVMVPIRALDPIGAIGTYWSDKRSPDEHAVRLLQALADTTAVTMENVRAYTHLEDRVRERTAELEAFTHAVSHDLRAPLRHVQGFAAALLEDHADAVDRELKRKLDRIVSAADRMRAMIDALLALSQASASDVRREPVDLAAMARQIAEEIQAPDGPRVEFVLPRTLPATGDPVLLRNVLQNLLANAWKFSSTESAPRVELNVQPDSTPVYYVRDNGVGFDPLSASKLFGVFSRLHAQHQFPGTGVGLATVKRIVEKHGGKIWAESAPDKGATFYFTLGQ